MFREYKLVERKEALQSQITDHEDHLREAIAGQLKQIFATKLPPCFHHIRGTRLARYPAKRTLFLKRGVPQDANGALQSMCLKLEVLSS